MKISFIFPRWTEVFGTFSRIAQKASAFPPLNLCYLAAIAEQLGHTVQIVDGEVENLDNDAVVRRVSEFSPDIIGMTSTTPMFHIVRSLSKQLKKAVTAPIIVGGHHASLLKEEAFDPAFDYLFIGEAEFSFRQFLQVIEEKGDISGIRGILYKKEGAIVSTGAPECAEDIDIFPFPARHLLKTELYKVGTLKGKLGFTTVMMSRGCPFKCVFCSTKVSGRHVRRRTVKSVVQEIELVVKNFNVRHIFFADDVLTLDKKFTLDLCDALNSMKIPITFEGSTRANLVDEELISAMKKAGLIRISFGLESADQQILKIIRKEVPLESYITANKLTNKYKIETINSVMLGLPGDTRESINKTIDFLRNARDIQHATFGIAMPYPGTEFYEMALRGEHGLFLHTQDFSKYQRYGSAVLTVNGMTPEELLTMQKIGLFKIYAAPWRIIPALRRFGVFSLILPLLQALKALFTNKGANKTK